jgi:hypothetical protein
MLRSLTLAVVVAAAPLAAQDHQHQPGMTHPAGAADAREPGQSAFAAIAEVVAILQADPTTDWSKVDLEALRQHLRDMDDVTLRAEVVSRAVSGGMQFDVTGNGRVREAIRRMLEAHAPMLTAMPEWEATATRLANGVRLTVTSPAPALQSQIRGLGFIGMMTQGAHHTTHHLAIARGSDPHAGHH